MKTTQNLVENYLINVGFFMFIGLTVLSLLTREFEAITVARNMLFGVLGLSGVIVSAELDALLHGRIAGKTKRLLLIAQVLLLAFSLMLVGFAMVKFGLISSLARWD